MVTDILRNGNSNNFWDGSREKRIQSVKYEFVTKKGNFSGKTIKNLCTNEVMDYLTDKINYNTNKDSDIGSYFIKSYEFLTDYCVLGCNFKSSSLSELRKHLILFHRSSDLENWGMSRNYLRYLEKMIKYCEIIPKIPEKTFPETKPQIGVKRSSHFLSVKNDF